MPLGWGDIPFRQAIKKLEPNNCYFVIELRSRYFEYIKESKQFLETLIDHKVRQKIMFFIGDFLRA